MISLRLTTDIENKLKIISETENLSKTEIIRQALLLYMDDYDKKNNPYILGKDLFGKHGSGKGDLSKNYKTILKKKFSEKRSH